MIPMTHQASVLAPHTARRISIQPGSKMHGTPAQAGCLQGRNGASRGGLCSMLDMIVREYLFHELG